MALSKWKKDVLKSTKKIREKIGVTEYRFKQCKTELQVLASEHITVPGSNLVWPFKRKRESQGTRGESNKAGKDVGGIKMSRKLMWRNVSPSVEKVLCDVRDGRVVGTVRLKGNWWEASYIARPPMHTTTAIYGEEADAKRAIDGAVAENDRADIVIPEPEILVDIDSVALRNILAAPDLEKAKDIARNAMADPAKWFRELKESFEEEKP